MSKQSERKRMELEKSKAITRLSETQEHPQNQSTEPQPQPESGINQPEIISNEGSKRLLDRPGIVVIIGTVLLGVAGFIQYLNHTIAIWLLFSSLVAYAQAFRVEFKEHVEIKTSHVPNSVFGCMCLFAFIFCF